MFANILRTQARTALASCRTVTPIISRNVVRRSMQLLLARPVSRPLSTSSVLRNEDGPAERMGPSRGIRSQNPPSVTLYVGNLPYSTEEGELRELLSPFGAIQDIRVAYRRDGTASGFAHVQYERQEDATAAFESANEEPLFLMGRNLRVDYTGGFKATPVAEPNSKLYFNEFNGDEADLRKAAREFESSIVSFYMLKDLSSGQPTGTGFIEFMSVERATEALGQLNGMVLGDGKKLNLKYARRRVSRDASGNQRGRRAGYAGDWGGSRRSEQYQQDRRGGRSGDGGRRPSRYDDEDH